MTKQHILEEIKRTAKANGGVALGRQKFFSETGIKVSDWYGKYWVRWGDAIRDAGFTPNQLEKAYSEEWLLQKLAALTKELGRFPLYGDLRMKASRDDDFPSHSTFGRLGPKNRMMSKVSEYCQKHKGFEDVLPLCQTAGGPGELLPAENLKHHKEMGQVYLLKSGRYYKIGRSNASGRREYELQIQLPEQAKIVHAICTDDPVGIEAYWHERFKAQRKNGEWFELRKADVQAFKRRKFM